MNGFTIGVTCFLVAIATADGRKIVADYTYSGLQELVERIQRLE